MEKKKIKASATVFSFASGFFVIAGVTLLFSGQLLLGMFMLGVALGAGLGWFALTILSKVIEA